MKEKLQWIFVLSLCSLILAVLMQGPQWLHQQNPLSQGLAVNLNSDEAIYLARVQESLSGRPEQSAEAFTGHPNLKGTQFALIERFYGTAFRFTGWRASQVLTLLDVVVPILIFLSLVFFFQLLGFSRKAAVVTAALFCLLQLYNLNRPIHMRSSFLVMLWAITCIQLALKKQRWWSVPAGALLGLLVGIYVWSFMFAWAFWGVYFVWEFGEWVHSLKRTKLQQILWFLRPRKPRFPVEHWHILAFIGVVGGFTALPFILSYFELQHHPLIEYGSFRSGMHPGRLPESLIYSGLFFVAVASGAYAGVKNYQMLASHKGVFALLVAAFLYMNQQVIHGITFNFVSHGIFSLVLTAMCVIATAIVTKEKLLVPAALTLSIYTGAIAYDGLYVLNQWTVEESDFTNQHLVEALPILDELDRDRFVSDPDTLAFIAGRTHHDIVYSVYLKNVLMTHREIALRYCLTQLPVPPAERHIAQTQHLVMPDAVAAFKGSTRLQEVSLVESACREVDLAPNLSLESFEVHYIFWNEATHPEWNLRRLQVNLTEIASGEGWSVYRIER